MDLDARFESLWKGDGGWEFSPLPPNYCVFARKFSEWTLEFCAKVTQAGDLVAINQGKILLVDKYFEWRSVVPKNHRDRLSATGHTCIFRVFEQAYMTLRAMELALTPPMLFLPPPPYMPPPPQIAGIFLGELDKP